MIRDHAFAAIFGCAFLVIAPFIATAKGPRPAVNGRFAVDPESAAAPGTPFSADGWECTRSARGEVSWALLPFEKWAVRLGPGCVLKMSVATTVALRRGNHAFRLEHTHGKTKASLGFTMDW
jgi:hypothetical protein